MIQEPSKARILFIEDDITTADLIVMQLGEEGYDVIHITDGQEGLAAALTNEPDLILLDTHLPNFSGLDILEELNREGKLPGIPVMTISGADEEIEIARARELGATDNLIKLEFTPRDLLAKIEKILKPSAATKIPVKQGIPIKQAEEAVKRQVAVGAVENSLKPSVLLVEDDELLLQMLATTAGDYFTMKQSATIASAKRFLETNVPKAIILDVMLPDGNGIDFLEEIKADPRLAEVPVVMASNIDQPEDMKRSQVLGADDYLVKAVTLPDQIIARVKEVIRS